MVAELAALDERAVANDEEGRAMRDALDVSAGQFVAAVTSAGCHHFSCELIKPLGAPDAPSRKWGARLLEHFFNLNKIADYTQQVL